MFPSIYIYSGVVAIIIILILLIFYFKNKAKTEEAEKDLLSVKINTQNNSIDKLVANTAKNQEIIDIAQKENKKERELSDNKAIEKFNKITDIDTSIDNAINDVNKEI